MFSTLEVRWFYDGAIPPDVLAWFQRGGKQPAAPGHRVDHYFCLVEGDSLGIKVREGRMEVKQRRHTYRVVRLHERVAGVMESWSKWSFALAASEQDPASPLAPAQAWAAVEKKRWLRRYRTTSDGQIVAVSAREYPPAGCDWELTEVGVGGKTWWTVAFEAFGMESTQQETLNQVAGYILLAAEPPDLDAEHSCGYPGWLGPVARSHAA